MTTLTRLRELLAAATERPWVLVDDGFHAGIASKASEDEARAKSTYYAYANVCGGDSHEGYFEGPDAALIAAAVNALANLIRVAEAAQQVKRNFMAIDDGFYTGLVPPEFAPLLEPLAALEGGAHE